MTIRDLGSGNGGEGGSFTYTAVDAQGNSTTSTVILVQRDGSNPGGTQGDDVIDDGDATATNSTITGLGGNDVLFGHLGNDMILGGIGGDWLTGGLGEDTFVFSIGDAAATISGSGNNGSISGYDVVSDFETTSDTLHFNTAGFIAGSTNLVDGVDSTLTVDGSVIGAHSITDGMITFRDQSGSLLDLESAADLAAAVQYLQRQDLGNAGATMAFAADIDGADHTFVYQQVGNTANSTNDLLIDLQHVSVASISALRIEYGLLAA